MKYLFLYMIVAHLIGDFCLQCDDFCKAKREEGFLGRRKVIHAGIILALSWVLSLSWYGWWLAMWIAVSHLVIDAIKAKIEKGYQVEDNENTSKKVRLCDSRYALIPFLVDQVAHILSICFFCWLWLQRNDVHHLSWFEKDLTTKIVLFVVFAIIANKPTNIFIRLVLGFCQVSVKLKKDEKENLKGGTLIGTIERLLMMAFIVVGQYEAIGFLIAAKSILRFGDNEKAEYVLAGTFLSVSVALVLGLLIEHKCWLF